MTDKVIRRGYVKWTDDDGVFHKEPLADHPELLTSATPEQQLEAEEVRRLNAAGEEALRAQDDAHIDDIAETLIALKAAPEEVLTAAELPDSEAPASAPEEPKTGTPVAPVGITPEAEAHDAALTELRDSTSE